MSDEVKKEEVKPFVFDANSVIFMMYLMYRCNLLTRHNLKAMFKIIKEPLPVDVTKYLVEEGVRGT